MRRDGKIRSMDSKSHYLLKSPLERCEETAKSLANALYDGYEEGFHHFSGGKKESLKRDDIPCDVVPY